MAVAAHVGGRLGRYGKFKHKRASWLVGDADSSLVFRVTAKHIADGIPGIAFECAAAIAIKAVLGDKYDVIINKGIVKVLNIKEKLAMRFATSAELAAAYQNFDNGVTPNFTPNAEYELLPVPGWNRLGGKKRKSRTSRSDDAPKRKRSAPRRWIIGPHNVSILKDHPFFRAHIRPEDR